jgi:hypothetical protein
MAKRRVRGAHELSLVLASSAELAELYDDVKAVNGIRICADGQGSCIFKVYLVGSEEAFQGFLRVFRHAANGDVKAYVQWQHAESPDICRKVWHDLVKSPANSDGSYLRPGVRNHTVVKRIREYVRRVGKQASEQSTNPVPPPLSPQNTSPRTVAPKHKSVPMFDSATTQKSPKPILEKPKRNGRRSNRYWATALSQSCVIFGSIAAVLEYGWPGFAVCLALAVAIAGISFRRGKDEDYQPPKDLDEHAR